ncbi:COG3650 family protein [Erythrobacter sp. MTPC3]|uniref:COG3650 family protein n=1 Tax=Erythrobacter sp. MTPC3 TaxID=3056564 RepID=UPI0036F31137
MIAKASRSLTVLSCLLFAAACSPDDGIDPGGETFTGVSDNAVITLTGTEPFWGIEIAPDGELYRAAFSSPENPEGSNFAVTRFAGNNGLGFSGEMDGVPAQIALTPGACADGMSDRSYPYTATVALGDEVLMGCGYTSDEPFAGDAAP